MKKTITAVVGASILATSVGGAIAPTANAATARTYTVTGKAYLDKNNNKKLDKGEKVLTNRKIYISSGKKKVGWVRTNSKGSYSIKLRPGTYSLVASEIIETNSITTKVTVKKNTIAYLRTVPVKLSSSNPNPVPANPKPPVSSIYMSNTVWFNMLNKWRASKKVTPVKEDACLTKMAKEVALSSSPKALAQSDSFRKKIEATCGGEWYNYGVKLLDPEDEYDFQSNPGMFENDESIALMGRYVNEGLGARIFY